MRRQVRLQARQRAGLGHPELDARARRRAAAPQRVHIGVEHLRPGATGAPWARWEEVQRTATEHLRQGACYQCHRQSW